MRAEAPHRAWAGGDEAVRWTDVLVPVICLGALNACGSSGSHGATVASATSAFKLTRCMHAHGISSFPDPTQGQGQGGQGFPITKTPGGSTLTVGGIAFNGPAFQAAEKACRLFGGGLSPRPLSETQKEAMLARARCIRKHGVPNFPDPVFGAGGEGAGVQLPPSLSPDSPAIRKARQACANVGTAIPGSAT